MFFLCFEGFTKTAQSRVESCKMRRGLIGSRIYRIQGEDGRYEKRTKVRKTDRSVTAVDRWW